MARTENETAPLCENITHPKIKKTKTKKEDFIMVKKKQKPAIAFPETKHSETKTYIFPRTKLKP